MDAIAKQKKKLEELSFQTVAQLRRNLRKYSVVGISSMRKSELVSELRKAIINNYQRRPVHPMSKYTVIELKKMLKGSEYKVSRLNKQELMRAVATLKNR